ncbi:hypothetical protein V7077_18150, partial [Neobacillus vireti]
MYQFKIINSQEMWEKTIRNFKTTDCYYSFEYGNLFAKIENGNLMAAYYEDCGMRIFYPFIKRRVPHVDNELYDIVTPYGYGGPLISGINNKDSFCKFCEMFSSFCRLNNIIVEIIRFHPFY